MARSLETYAGKRRFAATPEPKAEKSRQRTAGLPRFVVHKHDATRLHYDLRLEMDGALASWAVPKGPSLNPADRRLAVETEDHPLEYADFEGRIPEGEYGAGDSLVWDRGTYETDPPGQASRMREKGHLSFVLHGQKLNGRWHLVRTRPRGGKTSWLLFKGEDDAASKEHDIVAEHPESVKTGRRAIRGPVRVSQRREAHVEPVQLLINVWPPMLATLSTPHGMGAKPYVFEVKYDGFRALAGISNGRVTLQSRAGLDLSRRFPKIAKALASIEAVEAVLDGEIIAFDARGRQSFEALQTSQPDQRYCVFDLLWLDGEDLRERPLSERRELLTSVLANVGGPIELAERLGDEVKSALAAAKKRGLEGSIAKDAGSKYRGGRRREWLKLKLHASQEVAIVGYLPLKNGEPGVGALLAAVYDEGRYRFAGKIGTGFTNALRRQLQRELDKEHVDAPPVVDPPRYREARWSEPRLVGEVEFSEWTRDGKLRQPAFKGLRGDKKPDECVRERAVG